MNPSHQRELSHPGPLLDAHGNLTQVGWARQPILDANLENVRFYPAVLRPLQRFRVKCWDYYGITTPTHFFSATLAHLGYAGQAFVYIIDFERRTCHEQTLTIPFGRGIHLAPKSTEGESFFDNGRVALRFQAKPDSRHLSVEWPAFAGAHLNADITLQMLEGHESTVIVIPIGRKRFYYNRKVNCMPAAGRIQWGETRLDLDPQHCLGNLDWGRGVWEYRSFWVWASASGFLPDGRTLGLNLGFGFGDTSAATENTLLLQGRIHKLGQVDFEYDSRNFMRPWRMTSPDGRLSLEFTPFMERVARTNLLLIASEVHQMFGHYEGQVVTDEGETVSVRGLIGWVEEHHARW
ncbi:MAG: DUF2804 domain-containing protein [Anaerolineae bacterium]|nr:DUF2804 domain-containing protein [Anaerolineae bacterium]